MHQHTSTKSNSEHHHVIALLNTKLSHVPCSELLIFAFNIGMGQKSLKITIHNVDGRNPASVDR